MDNSINQLPEIITMLEQINHDTAQWLALLTFVGVVIRVGRPIFVMTKKWNEVVNDVEYLKTGRNTDRSDVKSLRGDINGSLGKINTNLTEFREYFKDEFAALRLQNEQDHRQMTEQFLREHGDIRERLMKLEASGCDPVRPKS